MAIMWILFTLNRMGFVYAVFMRFQFQIISSDVPSTWLGLNPGFLYVANSDICVEKIFMFGKGTITNALGNYLDFIIVYVFYLKYKISTDKFLIVVLIFALFLFGWFT